MNEITQKFEFKKWIPIIVSICSLVFSILSYMKSERIKRKNDIITKLLMEQSTRASVVPYFNIVLRDERIIENNDKITLGIGVINIGKESATNVQLEPMVPKVGLEGYFKSDIGYNYGISEYLNRYYARSGEEIIFYIGILKNETSLIFLISK